MNEYKRYSATRTSSQGGQVECQHLNGLEKKK